MPRPRIHKDNAAKQKAYRERQKRAAAAAPASDTRSTGERLAARVLAADAAARARENA